MAGSTNISLSVLIPTRNEERNISGCINSVMWASEIIVYDSMSSDRTVEIAKSLGANVVQRSFDNFADHKNWALDNIPFNFDWVLILDADESITQELRVEIIKAIEADNIAGYYIPRKNIFEEKWIRHGGWFPDYQFRLFRIGKARYEKRIVHEHMVITGLFGYLKNTLTHNDSKGIERYFDRHNKYSSLEAVEAFKYLGRKKNRKENNSLNLPSKRRILKEFAYRFVPSRALVKFLWMYILKCGFLDGRMGFRYCLLHAFYEYQISLKLEELKEPNSPMRQKYKQYLK